jgi:hypothetical protein
VLIMTENYLVSAGYTHVRSGITHRIFLFGIGAHSQPVGLDTHVLAKMAYPLWLRLPR